MRFNKYIMIVAIALMGGLSSCSDFLTEKMETGVPADFDSKSKIDRMVVGLYSYERALSTPNGATADGSILACHIWTDRTADIIKFTTGGDAGLSRYDETGADGASASKYYNPYWKHRYYLIGRANEIIHYGKILSDKGVDMKNAIGEGAFWRAYNYYGLWSRYRCAFLNTKPVDQNNIDQLLFTRASEADVFTQMLTDVDMAIDSLPVKRAAKSTSHVIKATALHLKALIMSWQRDHAGVLECVRQIDEMVTSGTAGLSYATDLGSIFRNNDFIHNPEALFSLSFSLNRGGIGNRIGSQNIAIQYEVKYLQEIIGGVLTQYTPTNLGRVWGLAYPNSYAMSLYPIGDKRLSTYLRTDMLITNQTELDKNLVLPVATEVTDPVSGLKYWSTSNHSGSPKTLQYGDKIIGRDIPAFTSTTGTEPKLRQAAVSIVKYHDFTKDLTSDGSTASQKDIMIYRLSETYLLGAESAVLLGDQTKAVEYFNKSWTRAGNSAMSVIDFKMVQDEQARELIGEGRRWEFLNRNDIWYTQMKSYAGDFSKYPLASTFPEFDKTTYGISDGRDPLFAPNPELYKDWSDGNDRDARLRFLVKPHNAYWPVPKIQLESVGMENFEPSPGY